MAESFPERPISDKYYGIGTSKQQHRTKFENGLVLSRAANTRARKIFTVGWEFMPKSEYILFMKFFEETLGKTFSFTDPILGLSKTVRFTGDILPKARRSGWMYNKATGQQEEAFDTGPIELEEF